MLERVCPHHLSLSGTLVTFLLQCCYLSEPVETLESVRLMAEIFYFTVFSGVLCGAAGWISASDLDASARASEKDCYMKEHTVESCAVGKICWTKSGPDRFKGFTCESYVSFDAWRTDLL